MKPFNSQDYWMKLWNFVGEKRGLKFDVKLKVELLSSNKFLDLAKKDGELFLSLLMKQTGMSRRKVLEFLCQNYPNYFDLINNPSNINGLCFVIPYLKKQRLLKYVLKILPLEDVSNYDVLIYINEGNLEKRRWQWSTPDYIWTKLEMFLFLVIHEMQHAYDRLSGDIELKKEWEKYDERSSEILWEWIRKEVEENLVAK